MQQKYLEEGENTGHFVAVLSRSQQGTSHIEAIENPAGNVVQDVHQILEVFSTYFIDLCDSKVTPTEEELGQFLDQ